MQKNPDELTFKNPEELQAWATNHFRCAPRDLFILFLVAVYGLAIRQVISLTDADVQVREHPPPPRGKSRGRFYSYPAYRLLVPPLPPAGPLRSHALLRGTVIEFRAADENRLLGLWLKIRKRSHGIALPGTKSAQAEARQPLFVTERGGAFTYSGAYRVLNHVAKRVGLTASVFMTKGPQRGELYRGRFGDIYDEPFFAVWDELTSERPRSKKRR